MRTRVKICGFTRTVDANSAAALGVDAVGLVFYRPSPRFIEIEQAVAVSKALPAFVSVVALFVDAESAWIEQVLQHVPIDCLQFHGNETPDECRRYGKPYIKAVRMHAGVDFNKIERDYADARGLLVDAFQPGVQGGTGMGFDWNLIPDRRKLPLILAGGLTAENAAQAIIAVKPYALDVSSSVEAAKGIKDVAKMAAFIRKTNQTLESYD